MRAALVPLCLVLGLTAAPAPPSARASVPTGSPVFTSPTVSTNPYFPRTLGSYRIFGGRNEGEATVRINEDRPETRTFSWNGQDVTCWELRETEFLSGKLVEVARNWFAQADDGTVYMFGEVNDNYEDGVFTDHDGSWLVGGPGPSDPPETRNDPEPMIQVLANPEPGDEYMPEIDEEATVRSVGKRIRVPGGRAPAMVIRVIEQDDGEREIKTFARGFGLVRVRSETERLNLLASSLVGE